MKNAIKGKKTSAQELLNILKRECSDFVYRPPIDLAKIIACLDIHVEYISDEQSRILGEIKVENGEPKIIINRSNHMSKERERFTLAHELGHLCKHIAPNSSVKFQDTAQTMKRDQYWSIEEYEANSFAAKLLMPRDLLLEEITKILKKLQEENTTMTQDEFITALAKKFQVSRSAMRFRLKNLGILFKKDRNFFDT